MKIKLLILLSLGLIYGLKGQPVTPPSNSQPPTDERIRAGVLENGLTYYIKPTSDPREKISMYFTVKTGQIHEEPEEVNFAHHVEHLALRPTKNFPTGLTDNSKLLAKLGMSSQDMNAFVGQFRTSYYFKPPRGNKEAIETGLLWFKDIASGLDLSKESINRERGVLIQELTRGSSETYGAGKDLLYDYLFPCRSVSKNPADFINHIRQFPYQDLQKYHKKWYRPDLMAISIVGNIDDIDHLEEKIITSFAEVKHSPLPVPEKECLKAYFNNDLSYLTAQPRFAVVSRNLESRNGINDDQIIYHLIFRDRLLTDKPNDFNDYIKERSGKLIASILNKRLKESLKEYGNTFEFNSSYKFEEFPNSLHVTIGSKLNEEEIALNKALSIINQFKTHGITAYELEELKLQELKRMDLIDTSGTVYWEKQIQNHIVYQKWLSSNKIPKEIEWIRNLTLSDLNERLGKLISGIPDDIGIIAPDNYQSQFMTEKSIRKFLIKNFNKKPDTYVPRISEPVLMHDESLKTLRLRPIEELKEDIKGTRKIKLINGITIILRPQNGSSSDGKIHLHGYSNRGASSFLDKDYYSAMFAPYIIRHSGIGHLDKFTLDAFYEKNNFGYQFIPYLHLNEAGIRTQVSTECLETVLQLIFLYFTKPRKDKVAFKDWKRNYSKGFVAFPTNDLLDALNEVTGDFTRLPYSSRQISGLKKVEFEEAFRIYGQIFGNAQDFTFIVTGDFTYNNVVPLLQKYLGNLPNITKGSSEPLPEPVEISPGPISREFPAPYQLTNFYYRFKYVYRGFEHKKWQEEIKVKALGLVINRMARDLRYKDGLPLYYFGASGKYNRELERFEISFSIQSPPEEFEKIKERTFVFLNNLKKSEVPRDHVILSLKNIENMYSQTGTETPSVLIEKLYRYYRFEEPVVSSTELLEYIESLTIDDIVDTAKKYFKEENFYEVLIRGVGN